ncbi:MAG: hypothetical protein K2Y37_23850 [Pirellulales bacterium]|nr:hypothetical protein [Pirellulales bacterium]
MSSRRARTAFLAGGAGTLCLFLGVLWLAWRHEPSYYREALALDAADLARGSDELLAHAGTLASDAQRHGHWRALFTAAQVNGWLATDVPRNHPTLLPPELCEPRVAIDHGGVWLAGRWGTGRAAPICSLRLDVRVLEPNTLAVRIRRMRAGLFPLPMQSLLDGISRAAANHGVHLAWKQTGGDPVAVLRLPSLGTSAASLEIEQLQLAAGEIFVAGKTSRAAPPPLVADQRDAGTNENRQR